MSVVVDTNICIYLLTGRLIAPVDRTGAAVSVITELERLAFPDITVAEEAAARQLLASVEVVGLSDAVRGMAIRVRREHRLRMADAIVAATAISRRATLISNDAVFARVPSLTVRHAALRPIDPGGSP